MTKLTDITTNWLDPTLCIVLHEGRKSARLYWPESGCMVFGDLLRHADGTDELFAEDDDHAGMVWYVEGLAPGWTGNEVLVKAQLRTEAPFVD